MVVRRMLAARPGHILVDLRQRQITDRLRTVMSDVPGEKASGLLDPRINSRFSQSPAIFKPAFVVGNQGLCVCLCRASCRSRRRPLRVNQTQQLHQPVRAPRSPSSAVLRHPTMRAAVLAKASPHVHHNLRGLNRFDRNTAFVKVIEKLPTGGAEMFDGIICVAGALKIRSRSSSNRCESRASLWVWVMAATPECLGTTVRMRSSYNREDAMAIYR
jgi:hypothetical protein